ncbi:hypothetical protein ODI_R1220 [Orrella dioscoreae]|uniref:Phage protein n=2 Tax=Orrella dioscoreae TaxID=1851544 RepID=A0A1C3K7Q6_9BURK|nr:hypothetical protein ODI_02461 [Orrella dioscoreae]SOE48077.1 hypothetical protein ODI_R1220 [Orrella dioscoreae]
MERRSSLKTKTPMKRGGWLRAKPGKPKGPGLAQRLADVLGVAIDHKPKGPTVYRSRQHRQNVAELSCVQCGKQQRSQCAHLNLLAVGKGKGLKVSDALTVPLCADGLAFRGCHSKLDQGGVYDKPTSASLQILWLQQTRTELQRLGQWPEAAEADFVRHIGAYLARGA